MEDGWNWLRIVSSADFGICGVEPSDSAIILLVYYLHWGAISDISSREKN
jgi:hypothetical protein